MASTDRDVAALSLKLQQDLSLRPTKAARLAKMMGENAAPLLAVDSKTLAETVSSTVKIRPEDLFSPMQRSAAPTKGGATLGASLSSSATAAIAKASATATARRAAAPMERTHNPLTGKTLLVDLPAKPLRRRSKDDLWTDLAKIDAAEAVKEAAARKKAAAAEKARYQNELNSQLEDARKAAIEAHKKELEYADSVLKASQDYNKQQAEIAAKKAAKARGLAEESKRLMAEANAEKESAKARKLAEETLQLQRLKQAEKDAQAKAAEKRKEELEAAAQRLKENKAELAAKRVAMQAQRDADAKMLAEAARVMEEREKRRLQEVAEREAAIRAKMDSMKEVFASSAAAEQAAIEKAERERKEFDRKRDEEAAARVAKQVALKAAIKENLKSQEQERIDKIMAIQKDRIDSLAEVEVKRKAFIAEERAKAEKKLREAAAFKEDVERQVLGDWRRGIVADVNETEKALNRGVLAGTAKPFNVTSTYTFKGSS